MQPIVLNIIAMILTLCVLSRIIGDNPAFRITQYLFVGVSLGYTFVVIYHQVLLPVGMRLSHDMTRVDLLVLRIVPFLLGLLLLPRMMPRQTVSWLANIPLALIFGVSAGLALIGALAGTLLPQMADTARPFQGSIVEIIGTAMLLIGVVLTLSYFYFTVPRETPVGRMIGFGAVAGRWLLMVVFGFFFAGALITYLTALNERLTFLVDVIKGFGLG
ncbi:MAG: hypothetical protein HC837_10900 [Chloroflexaceae bacterium]|nr:hypothetical protein [Chloroflexaceae bacterium]